MSRVDLACAAQCAPADAAGSSNAGPWRAADDKFLPASQVVLATLTAIAAAIAFLLLA